MAVPLVADSVARAVALGGRAILLKLGREAHRRYRGRGPLSHDPAPAVPIPRRAVVRAVYAAWACGLVAFALAILNVHLFLPAGRVEAIFQLAVGAILLVEGLGLVAERFLFRRLLGAPPAARSRRGGGRLWRAGRHRLVGAALTALGIVWVGMGVLNVVRGAVALL